MNAARCVSTFNDVHPALQTGGIHEPGMELEPTFHLTRVQHFLLIAPGVVLRPASTALGAGGIGRPSRGRE
eukprot:3744546-Pyramimonas_sp.AAC.1